MLVNNRMTRDPVTVTGEDLLIQARLKMQKGGFRGIPVVRDGYLVGIITDRDIREHSGYLDRTQVKSAMSTKPITVTPGTTVEVAAQLLLKQKIGGLPVVEKSRLVGILTTSDILEAFLDVMGALEETSTRIDFVLEDEGIGLAGAAKIVAQEGGEILSVGTHRKKWGETRVCYLRLRSGDTGVIASVLRHEGYEVLGMHASD